MVTTCRARFAGLGGRRAIRCRRGSSSVRGARFKTHRDRDQADGRRDQATRVEADLGAFRAEASARFVGLERRLDTVDSRLSAFDHRFDSLQANFDRHFDTLQANFDLRLDSFQARFDAIDERPVGILALFGTLTALLMAIGQLRP